MPQPNIAVAEQVSTQPVFSLPFVCVCLLLPFITLSTTERSVSRMNMSTTVYNIIRHKHT